MRVLNSVSILILLAVAAVPARAQFTRGLNFTGAVSVDVPLGDLDKDAKTGFGVLIRGERQSGSWALRTGLSFDRFGGKGSIDNLQFFTFLGGELVHHSGTTWYQFGGIGFYQSRAPVRQDMQLGGAPSANASGRAGGGFWDFGFQAGVGVNYTLADTKTFIEFGFVNVLTTGPTSVWVPVRFGIRL
jgi:hypothetical protein